MTKEVEILRNDKRLAWAKNDPRIPKPLDRSIMLEIARNDLEEADKVREEKVK